MPFAIDRKKIKGIASILALNLLLAILIVFFLCPSCFFSLHRVYEIWDDILYSYLLCLVLGIGNEYINNALDQKISWIREPVKRLLLNIIAMVAYSFFASLILVYLFINLVFTLNPEDITWQQYIGYTYVPIGITVVIATFLTSRGFLLSWREAAIETEKLKTENITSRYESLKNQVNPHFLFNSLNTLSSLVYEDPDMAAQFVRKLADVYRYVLDTRNQEVVSLAEERAFVISYIFLQKIRYENNLQVTINLPDDSHMMIPPLSLQMLLENAMKHNEISDEKPLHIDLYLENDEYIVVRNSLQRKNTMEKLSGVGLNNIQWRYEYLTKKTVKIWADTDEFVVKLPVLNVKPL